jgi:transposase-like protein
MSRWASRRKEPRTSWAFGSRPRKALWLRVMTELKNRGVEDILIAVVDGLNGFPEAIAAVFQPTIVQTCIVHLIRNSMDFASWKDRKPTAAELKAIYRATDTDVARRAGGATGTMSSHSSPFPSLCGASFTPRTPSNP